MLEAEKSGQKLDESEEFGRLEERARKLKADLDDTLAEFDGVNTAFKEIGREQN